MQQITDQSGLDEMTAQPSALLLKHGAHCPISANARDEVGSFEEDHPDVPVYSLEVTENPALSRDVAESLGIRHESPQLILLNDGEPVWHVEHYDISADDIESRLEADD